jgi:long-chain acyl-CoA synthetase
MNLAKWLCRAARLDPDAPALLRGTDVVATYAGFAEAAARLATALIDRFGIEPGDRVALFMANRTEYLEVLYAAWHAGAVVVPINYKLHPKEACWIIDNAGAKIVFTSADLLPAMQDLTPGLAEPCQTISVDGSGFAELRQSTPMAEPLARGRDDLAWLFYTSGTTGRPKGVMLSNDNLHTMAFCYFVDVDEVHASDAALYAAPMSHGAGIYNFMHVLRGAKHVIPESGGFNPAEILALGRAIGGISMFAAPTMVRRLIEQARAENSNGDGLRTIVYGGGPMYLADIDEGVDVFGPRFVQIYGQGECPMAITALSRDLVADRSHPRWRERVGSVGLAQSCVEVQIVDQEGATLPANEKGDIVVRGAPVMLGYWRNPDATRDAIRDGWLWTGDVGMMDEDGFVTLSDRSKDVIISGGTNIYPREVEEVLLNHPSVVEVSVVGRSNPEWGEDVVAFIVAKPGVELPEAELDQFCTDNMARFKRPKLYVFLSALPKNNYGKVMKTELRQRLEES